MPALDPRRWGDRIARRRTLRRVRIRRREIAHGAPPAGATRGNQQQGQGAVNSPVADRSGRRRISRTEAAWTALEPVWTLFLDILARPTGIEPVFSP